MPFSTKNEESYIHITTPTWTNSLIQNDKYSWKYTQLYAIQMDIKMSMSIMIFDYFDEESLLEMNFIKTFKEYKLTKKNHLIIGEVVIGRILLDVHSLR